MGQGGDDRQQTDPPTSQTPLPLPPIPKPQGATADSLTNSKHLNFETLKKTLFEECGFRGLSGSGLDLTESTFLGCDLGQMAIPGSKMTDVALSSCHANGADFSNGNLQGSSLTMSQFAEANFSGCDLRGVNFYESDVLLSDLSNTDYSHALNIMPLKLRRLNNERRRVA